MSANIISIKDVLETTNLRYTLLNDITSQIKNGLREYFLDLEKEVQLTFLEKQTNLRVYIDDSYSRLEKITVDESSEVKARVSKFNQELSELKKEISDLRKELSEFKTEFSKPKDKIEFTTKIPGSTDETLEFTTEIPSLNTTERGKNNLD